MLEGPIKLYYQFINYIVGGLALLAIGLGAGWYITNLKLDTCQQARKTDKVSYEAAAAESLVLHLEAIKKKEQEYAIRAKQADANYASLNTKFNDSVRVYAEANKRATSVAIASSKGGDTEGVNGPSKGPNIPGSYYTKPELDITEVTVVPVEDLFICAENTARLIVARDWALGIK